jgi:hypothetical protein
METIFNPFLFFGMKQFAFISLEKGETKTKLQVPSSVINQ